MLENSRADIKDGFVEMFEGMNSMYHLTVTFKAGTSDALAERKYNRLLDRINRKIFPRKYFNYPDKHMTGAVARERNSNGTLHFHTIIADRFNNLPDEAAMRAALSYAIPTIKSDTGRPLLAPVGCCLQRYYNDGSSALERYITKNMENWSMTKQEAFDSIGLIGISGACFGSGA